MKKELLENVKNDRFAQYVGINLIKVEPDYAKAEMPVTENHLNGVNMVQGGAIFTLADYAFAAASNSSGFATVGIQANISYFKSPTGKTLVAEATKINGQNKLCSYNVDVFDQDKSLIARFTAMGYIKRN
jgi:acyl-CoA thioesterase